MCEVYVSILRQVRLGKEAFMRKLEDNSHECLKFENLRGDCTNTLQLRLRELLPSLHSARRGLYGLLYNV